MKKIECYLREEDADHVLDALSDLGVNGVTLCPVQGFGRQRGGLGGRLLPKVKVEVLALDVEVEGVLQAITAQTQKGNYGDGKIAVIEVANAIRVRTGETGAKALM